MGVTAKKAIGMMATATAAIIVTMLTDKAKVGFVSHDDTANTPARKRRPIAEASATINPIILLRRRRLKSSWSDMVLPEEGISWQVSGRCRDESAARRANRRKFVAGCQVAAVWPRQRTAGKAQLGALLFYDARSKARRFEIM